MNIFTNVWGYVPPVSPWFRGKFWLPFGLLAIALFLLAPSAARRSFWRNQKRAAPPLTIFNLIASALLLSATFYGLWKSGQIEDPPAGGNSLTVMTYNIQQANDAFGQKSYERQLALMQRVQPDVIALQESDSARISLGNNDYVRYYASSLGYYSYYGPTPVAGTYGTAILSRYPLENTRVIYSYSDQDEIGTAVAEISVGGKRFTIFNVHPDGSDIAKRVFAETLLAQVSQAENVIALGDYNLRGWEEPYMLIDAVLKNGSASTIFSSPRTCKSRILFISFPPNLLQTIRFTGPRSPGIDPLEPSG